MRSSTLDPAIPGRPDAQDPAPPAFTGGGGGGRWAWLVTARDVYEAELLRGSLESEGVPVALHGRDCSPFAWMYPAGNMNVPVQVFVPATLLDAARLHILESSFAAPGTDDFAARAQTGGRRTSTRLWIVVGVASAVAVLLVVIVELLGVGPCRQSPTAGRSSFCSVR